MRVAVIGVLQTMCIYRSAHAITVTACGTDVASGGINLSTALAAGGVVRFQCRTGSTTIIITRQHVLQRSVELDGGGHIILDARGRVSMFGVPDGTVLTLRHITVRGGANPFVQFRYRNTIPPFIGGIASGKGSVKLADVSTVSSKNAYDVASFVSTEEAMFQNNSGAFVVRANAATLVDATFADNQAAPIQSRPLASGRTPKASLNSSELLGNQLPLVWSGNLEILQSKFVNNGTPESEGGALRFLSGQATIGRSTFANNRAKTGGAIFLGAGSIEITQTDFEGNTAAQGGGAIAAHPINPALAEIVLRYAKLRGNQAYDGGAIELIGRMNAGPVLFARNTATRAGGALRLGHGEVHLRRTVFTDNRAGVAGGAIHGGRETTDQIRGGNILMARNSAPSGAAFVGSNLSLANATVVANEGVGIVVLPLHAGVPTAMTGVSLTNTILRANVGGNCSAPPGLLKDNGHNVQFPHRDCGASITSVDPMIDNMYVPAVDSPVRFAGDQAVCQTRGLVDAQDVYGGERPENQICTIGAVEQVLDHQAVRLLPRRENLPKTVRSFLQFLWPSRR